MAKRKWNPVLVGTKFYTGWQGDIGKGWHGRGKDNGAKILDQPHESQVRTLSYKGMGRGRSAVNFYFTDGDDFCYTLAAKCMAGIVEGFIKGDIETGDGTFTMEFEQVKQGQNYFIQPVKEIL